MSAPVIPSAPAVRSASTGGTSDATSTESATPFASALDGALAEGRGTVGDGTTGDGEPRDPEFPAAPAEAADLVPPVGLPAPLWALALGAPQAAGQAVAADGTGATSPAGGVPGIAATAAGMATAPTAVPPAVPTAPPTPGSGAGLPPAPSVVPGGPGAPAVPGTVPAPPGGEAAAAVPGRVVLDARTPSTPVPDSALPGTPVPSAGPSAVPTGQAGAGTGGTGQDTGGAPTGGDTAAPTTTAAGGPAFSTAAAVAPAAGADGATGTAASLPVAGQVARQIAVLRGAPDGSHTMTLVLTPETLGPVEVSVTVNKGAVDLVLRGAHEHGRAALLDALPDLRRDLEAAGLTTSKLEVAKDSGGSWLDRHAAGQQAQQGFGDRAGQQGASEGRSRSWLRPADSGETRTVPTTGSTSSGVDVRV